MTGPGDDRALAAAARGAAWVRARWSVEHQRTDLLRALRALGALDPEGTVP